MNHHAPIYQQRATIESNGDTVDIIAGITRSAFVWLAIWSRQRGTYLLYTNFTCLAEFKSATEVAGRSGRLKTLPVAVGSALASFSPGFFEDAVSAYLVAEGV